MGCGCSSETRKRHAKATEELKQLRDRDIGLQEEHVELSRACSSDALRTRQSLAEARLALEEQEAAHARELESHREELHRDHTVELHAALREREITLQKTCNSRVASAEETARAQHSELLRAHAEAAEAEAAKHRDEIDAAESEAHTLRSQVAPLRAECGQAELQLRSVRGSLEAERSRREEECARGELSLLERDLVQARTQHERAQQTHGDLERHLRLQTTQMQSELRERQEELQRKTSLLRMRDRELIEVNSELAELQGLFDDANRQLTKECGRVEKLQSTVQLCAKQGKELETLQSMVEDSHSMLEKVRDSLEQERSEREHAANLLEQEQQRTKLLLDVLRHFKEKLQGLTPQMLMSKLGISDPKALLACTAPFDFADDQQLPAAAHAAQAQAPPLGGLPSPCQALPLSTLTSPRTAGSRSDMESFRMPSPFATGQYGPASARGPGGVAGLQSWSGGAAAAGLPGAGGIGAGFAFGAHAPPPVAAGGGPSSGAGVAWGFPGAF